MPRSNSRGGRNNNPEGRNQHSDWGVMEMARERPFAAAAAAAGAAAAGLFLWSKRTQITDQINSLSDQIGEWREGMSSGGEFDDTSGLPASASTGNRSTGTRSTMSRGRSGTSARGMSTTGGGNASLGARSGGGGTTGGASGRGRARQTTPI